MKKCEICMGSGIIRLPINRPLSAIKDDEIDLEAPTESSREFTCPECSDGGPVSTAHSKQVVRHAYLKEMGRVRGEVKAGIVSQCARQIGEMMAREGFVIVSEKELVGGFHGQTEITVSMSVVAPSHVASLKERVEENSDLMIRKLCALASEDILHWGSDYSGSEGSISKAQAVSSLCRARDKMLESLKTGPSEAPVAAEQS